MRHFLLISKIKIHNANAMSSPYTIGFPAMTAWLGAVHALQRHIQQQGFENITLSNVAISCHEFNLQTYKGKRDFVNSIISTSNPLDKSGARPAFIEEARCHLEVSLLIEIQKIDPDIEANFKQLIEKKLYCMKIASGDVLSFRKTEIVAIDEDDVHDVKNILKKLMLGYVLVERRQLLAEHMQNENKDALDALIDHLKITHQPTKNADGKTLWISSRKESGWLIPIAVGFQGISELGKAKNQRDNNTSHRFAESVITLGEFKMPYRINDLDNILWHYNVDREKNLYLCQTLSPITKQEN